MFFRVIQHSQLVVVDVTEIYYKEDASGKRIDEGRWQPGWSLDFRYVKDAQDYYAGNMREMQLGREDRVLYVTDINTSGKSQFGLLIDEEKADSQKISQPAV